MIRFHKIRDLSANDIIFLSMEENAKWNKKHTKVLPQINKPITTRILKEELCRL